MNDPICDVECTKAQIVMNLQYNTPDLLTMNNWRITDACMHKNNDTAEWLPNEICSAWTRALKVDAFNSPV